MLFRSYCKGRKTDGIYKKEDILPIMIDDGTLSGFLFSGVNNSIFKRKIIKENNLKFNESIRYNEDSLFSFEYALHSESLYCLQSVPLYFYRQHAESATKKRVQKDKYSKLHKKLTELSSVYPDIEFDLQMRRRLVTVALWEILDIADKEKGIRAIKKIKRVLQQKDLNYNIDALDTIHMNKYKRVYQILLKYKMAGTLYFVSKRLKPFLSKYLIR